MKKIVIVLCILLLIGSVSGCRPKARVIEELQKVEEMDQFEDYNGFRVEEGRFYFTAIEEGNFNVYSIDLNTKEVNKIFSQIDQFDSFIPLEKQGAVYVDGEGILYHTKEEQEKKIDEKISGMNSPNVLVAPNREGFIYTKGTHEESDLYLYIFEKGEPQLIVSNITEEAYKDFHFMTQWAPTQNHFIFDNRVYNKEGEEIASINATSTKWAPNGEYIAYIQMPKNQKDKTIIIGDWTTYIGDKLILFNIDSRQEETILERPEGLIDPIDSIQWSRDSKKVAIVEGDIIIQQGVLDGIDYKGVRVYNIENQEIQEIEEASANFYQILFDNYIYTKRLGVKSPLEIIPMEGRERKVYEEPLLLNNRSMFIIEREEKGYLINGRELIELNPKGEAIKLLALPWDPLSMYLDEENESLIIINRNLEMYLYRL